MLAVLEPQDFSQRTRHVSSTALPLWRRPSILPVGSGSKAIWYLISLTWNSQLPAPIKNISSCFCSGHFISLCLPIPFSWCIAVSVIVDIKKSVQTHEKHIYRSPSFQLPIYTVIPVNTKWLTERPQNPSDWLTNNLTAANFILLYRIKIKVLLFSFADNSVTSY